MFTLRANTRPSARGTKWPQPCLLHPSPLQYQGRGPLSEGSRRQEKPRWEPGARGRVRVRRVSLFLHVKERGWVLHRCNSNFLLCVQSETGCMTLFGLNQRGDGLAEGRGSELEPLGSEPLRLLAPCAATIC